MFTLKWLSYEKLNLCILSATRIGAGLLKTLGLGGVTHLNMSQPYHTVICYNLSKETSLQVFFIVWFLALSDNSQ